MTTAQPIPISRARVVPAPETMDVLLGRAATGDEAAFMRIYELTANCVYGLALRLLEEPAEAEDVATAAYVEIWSTSSRFDSTQQSAEAWIMGTAHAHVVNVMRTRAKQEQIHLTDVTDVRRAPRRPALHSVVRALRHHGPHERAGHPVRAESSRDAFAVVPAITVAQRQALVLAYLDGHTLTEVAVLTRVPTEVAAFRIRAGLTRLRGRS